MLSAYAGGDRLHEEAHLLVGVARLDGNVDMQAGGARCFQEGREMKAADCGKQQLRRLHNGREGSAGRGIEIEKSIIGMVRIVVAAGPRIVVYASEVGEIEKRRQIVCENVVNRLAAIFGLDGSRLDPLGRLRRCILLKKSASLNAVRIAAKHHGAIFEQGKQDGRDAIIVREELAL